MMSYVPNTPAQREDMLLAMGKTCMEDLFDSIPASVRVKGELDIPGAKSEIEVLGSFEEMAGENQLFKTCFRGAGAYKHFIPSVVRHLAGRAEFVTAYTPYQAEMSQGVLQPIFEYQTMICELTGMDVSNAGVYDGAHAAAEAVAMFRQRKRTKAIISATVKPMVLETIMTYCAAAGTQAIIIPAKDGKTDLQALGQALDDTTACFYMEQLNYYGLVEDAQQIADIVHAAGAKLIMGCYPTALAVLKTPAEYGADAAVGEAQPLGLPLAFGGPYLGFMAVRTADTRRLPGRIVGQTKDKEGRTAYVLTLQAREQHIRREKSGSSICSNQALCALTSTIYCAALGQEGMREVAEQCLAKAHYAAEQIAAVKGYNFTYDGVFFNEFLTDCPVEPEQLMAKLAENNILGGLPIKENGKNCILWCVTELNTKAEIDRLVDILKEAV
ncbi:MAG TPA: aminomethyl-transferring glycine dehydrogenase subunit GcvPA [Clostridia bacterium]|nr:aminomethyl-transferring glycine dehydrogenase subunit GcvPA [Clostridia bacterium]